MAYLMKYRRMGLMDAYLVTRARRLNGERMWWIVSNATVLIQPNLRFFHELFGWEAELARTEAEEREERRKEAESKGVRSPEALALLDNELPPRPILYSWPTFCRDVVSRAAVTRAASLLTDGCAALPEPPLPLQLDVHTRRQKKQSC